MGDSAVVGKVRENAKRIEAILDEFEREEIEAWEVRRLLEGTDARYIFTALSALRGGDHGSNARSQEG